jgi:hypothetical protein
VVQVSLGKKQDPILKIAKAKRVSGVTQAGERLPFKNKALGSNTSMAKKKNYGEIQ